MGTRCFAMVTPAEPFPVFLDAPETCRFGTTPSDLTLQAPRLLRALEHWNALRGGQALPARRVFDPLDVPDILANVFLAQRLDDGDWFYRVVGTRLVSRMGFDPTRKPLSSLDRYVSTKQVSNAFNAVCNRALPSYSVLRPFRQEPSWRRYHRLLLPLGETRDSVSHILGCSDFDAE